MTETPALFADLDEAALRARLPGLSWRSLQAGERLHPAGQEGEAVYIVTEGRLALLFDRGWGELRVLEFVEPGGTVGEAEAYSGESWLAETRAERPCRLAVVAASEFIRFMQAEPALNAVCARTVRQRMCRLLVTRHLTELFGIDGMSFSDPAIEERARREWIEFEQDVLDKLERSADWVTLERGEYLFRQGDAADGAYVLVSGLLRVSVEDRGDEKTIARIRQGEILGEMSLITAESRAASISALRDCELFRLSAAVFRRVTEQYPRNVLKVYRTVTERFRESLSGSPFRERIGNIALLAAGPDVDLAGFSERLRAHLAAHGPVECLDRASVDAALGRTGAALSEDGVSGRLRLVQWLNALELRFEHLLYRGDPGWSAWNTRCLRQSDRVVVVADARREDADSLATLRTEIARSGLPWSLALLHPPDVEQPRGTASWLDRTGALSAYHVRDGNAQDMARLARILSGRAVSLVLGGGGARGFAHLGVLRALEELGVPIDMVGGTSIGAPIGAWVAMGMNAAECFEEAHQAFRALIDLTLPTTALLAGKRISRTIREQADGLDIEDFWRPYFCVSTNLTHSRVEVHRRGGAARAIRSSVSIPGVLPPVPRNGELLVDGGVLNNLPVDVMREFNPSGTVLAIDVVLPKSFFTTEDYGTEVSGWRQLVSRILPGMRAPETPSFGSVLMQSMMVGSSHSRDRVLEQGQADFYRNIHVHGIGLLQFEALEEAAEVGYRESIGPLREWLATRPDLQAGGG